MGIGTLDPASNAAQVLESNSYEANNQVVWVSSRANVPERGSGQRLLALTRVTNPTHRFSSKCPWKRPEKPSVSPGPTRSSAFLTPHRPPGGGLTR